MPSNADHTSHSFQRYGVCASDVHEWMDEPSQITGNHRKYRHNPDMEIPRCFIEKYGEELARNIILDHIYLDGLTELRINDPKCTDGFYFPVDFLFDECPYEYLSKEWHGWNLWKKEQEIIDLIIKKHIESLERYYHEKKIWYYNKYPTLHAANLTTHNRDFWERQVIKKIDEYLSSNGWEILWE